MPTSNLLLAGLLAASALACNSYQTSESVSKDSSASSNVASKTSTTMPAPAPDSAVLGQPAPDFELRDLDGKAVRLSSFRGKTVVLEWFNPECPFVVYAHQDGPLSDMAGRWTAKDVVWLAINSGAPGKQGTGADLNRRMASTYGMHHPVLLDEDGKVGRAYGAKTTPQMFVVDAKGVLRYRGGLDNAPRGRADGERQDYFEDALDAVVAGRPVAHADTTSYGCSVKYDG